jgi:capsular polysaccharide transport system permease protein
MQRPAFSEPEALLSARKSGWPRLRRHLLLSRHRVLRWTLLLPSILAVIYYGLIAANQYESEARFVVRSAARPDMSSTLSFLVQLGLARSQDDSFIVQDFIGSRDAVDQLKVRLPLLRIYGHDSADFLAGYPSLLYGPEEEQLYRYLKDMISVVHSERTGISTLRVRAFDAADARAVAETLLQLGEELVNRLNTRLQTDAVAHSAGEVKVAQERLIEAQTRLTEFRNREMMVDPGQNAVALAELIAHLSGELAVVQSQVAEMKASAAASPQLVGMQRKTTALEQQIAQERRRIAEDRDGLATRIAAYERLQLEREFAQRLLATSEAELVRTRNDAARQMLYLERVTGPHTPDYARQPRRLRLMCTAVAANLIVILLVWLIVSGMREHAPQFRS